eukprot:SAG31_NODE_603_length_13622_cov_19.019953_7_plen_105_part_00
MAAAAHSACDHRSGGMGGAAEQFPARRLGNANGGAARFSAAATMLRLRHRRGRAAAPAAARAPVEKSACRYLSSSTASATARGYALAARAAQQESSELECDFWT